MDKIKNILKFAMRMEKDAENFYQFYADKAASEDIRQIFGELVEVEKQHYEILKQKFDELQYSEPPRIISWVVDENFKARDPHIIADNSDLVGELDDNASDITILRMAYLIENDFEFFYNKAADAVEEPEAKKFLLELAQWEKQHRDMFDDRYKSLLNKYWGDVESLIL